ncbi:MAG: D-alanyl-D-alanine carboxypeptidase/D-alanyl-D-alanine-endopeptidase [Bacteroidota bacterium]|nr:D-alanyl-D-alanine carboxypeptidase/D-alanyl-D-alanine-endopeptidase [Bacteroidota bacterium]
MKKIKLVFPLLLLSLLSVAGNPVDDFVNNPLLVNANVSLLVKDLATNKTICQFRPNNSTIPASTMKLVTTATALELLGPNFCFETKLEIDGTISAKGELDGNLYIRGGGDPTLASEHMGDPDFLTKWVEEVKKTGIRKINGQIIADGSLYDNQGVNSKWTWEDIGNYYAAGAYGISYMDNTYQLVLRSGVVGSTPEILRVVPEIPALTFENQLKSTEIAFDSAYFYGAPHSYLRSIHGEIPANRLEYIIKGDIPNPGLLLAEHFQRKLIESGISINQLPSDVVSMGTGRRVILVQKSPPLSDIIRETNVHSNNGYAEQIFRYLALTKNKVASTNGALQVVRAFWKAKGLPVEQLFMYDGCGLSPEDAVSSQFLVDLLIYMQTISQNKEYFFNSLPVSGKSGTLTSFLAKTALQGKVHAKSGTISRVKCYAGYIEGDGKNYVFSILVNNPNGSSKSVVRKIEKFLLEL